MKTVNSSASSYDSLDAALTRLEAKKVALDATMNLFVQRLKDAYRTDPEFTVQACGILAQGLLASSVAAAESLKPSNGRA